MNIHWWRATLDGLEPSALQPLHYALCIGAIVLNVVTTALNIVAGAYWQAGLTSLAAAAVGLIFMRGVYDAERQAGWRRRIERDLDLAARERAIARFPHRERS